MARAPGGARRRDAAGGGEAVRKGLWMAEEDEMPLEHVRTHGPRDWSTGKSCRLRWVNTLRPNLKTGCKFSSEEKPVVIVLQAQFGNKWARIATYLKDYDVKNFWSTRQKRLARLLCAPLPARSNKNSSNAKAPARSLESRPATGSSLDRVPFEGNSSVGHCCAAAPFMEYQDAARIQHDQTGSGFLSFEGPLPLQVAVAPATDGEASSSNAAPLAPPELPFDQPPYPLLDFPGLPERCDIGPGFVDASAMDDTGLPGAACSGAAGSNDAPFFGMECPHDAVKAEPRDAPDNFFDDLPPDMFDVSDHLPPPLSPSGTKSELKGLRLVYWMDKCVVV